MNSGVEVLVFCYVSQFEGEYVAQHTADEQQTELTTVEKWCWVYSLCVERVEMVVEDHTAHNCEESRDGV